MHARPLKTLQILPYMINIITIVHAIPWMNGWTFMNKIACHYRII